MIPGNSNRIVVHHRNQWHLTANVTYQCREFVERLGAETVCVLSVFVGLEVPVDAEERPTFVHEPIRALAVDTGILLVTDGGIVITTHEVNACADLFAELFEMLMVGDAAMPTQKISGMHDKIHIMRGAFPYRADEKSISYVARRIRHR